jgi:hypothetical protein
VFTLAEYINTHKIASRVTGQAKDRIIEEIPLYQDASKGDGKRFCTPKEEIREILKRSPDNSDTWIMRMYFVIRNRMQPNQSEEQARVQEVQKNKMVVNQFRQGQNSTK